MTPTVLRAAAGAAFPTRERCEIRELLNDAAWPGASLAEARVAPGVTTELHALSVAEAYVITKGAGRVEVAGEWREIAAGDAVLFPQGAAQRVENTGAEDLTFLCLCTPRFAPEAYRGLEEAP